MQTFDGLSWAIVHVIDRKTQDDRKSKLHIIALFENPIVAEDSFLPHLPNPEVKRYLLHVNELERFEMFYNFIQDLKEKYAQEAILHLSEGNFSADEKIRFRSIMAF